MSTVKIITILSSIALSFSVGAATLEGKVIAIHDGDTLTVLVDRRQVKVRLVEIDAPELKQAFGNHARQSLSELCFGKPARLEGNTKDRYGRTLARVHCDGIDANAEMVRRGMAWVFDRYVTDRSLYGVQDEARQARRGLWADTEIVPPWEWRMAKPEN